jgi:hypothetical protein
MSRSGPDASDALERRYRRLLAWYPAEHRRVHGEEMIGVLLASAGRGRRRPGLAETLDMMRSGLRIRLKPRQYDGVDTGWRDTLAVASIVIPAMVVMVYAVIFAWTLDNRVSVAEPPPAAVLSVLTGFLLLIALPPVLALLGFRRSAMVLYFMPVLMVGFGAPIVSGADGGFFGAFLIAAVAFVLSEGPRRATQIMRPGSWVAMCGVGLALCVPEVMVRLPALHEQVWMSRRPLWLGGTDYTLIMIATLALIAVVGAFGVLRTLPSPIGRRLLMLLAVPAYPGVLTFATSGASVFGPFGVVGVVYVPTVLLACVAIALMTRSRRHGQSSETLGPPDAHC